MNQISNAEKQVRFRKKEQLKRQADIIFRKWQSEPWNWKSKTSQDVQLSLDKAIDLPPGWTDKHYERALQGLEQLHIDLFFTADQLKNDVDAGWNSLRTISDPAKYISDNKAAIKNARTLAAHLISALKLTNCNYADQAAALMEALRFVGPFLANNSDTSRSETTTIYPHSQAITICLAIISPHYSRPDWFAKELANTLGKQIGDKLARQVGQYLLEQYQS